MRNDDSVLPGGWRFVDKSAIYLPGKKKRLFLHFTPVTQPALLALQGSMRSVLPDIEIVQGLTIVPGKVSFDPIRRQYDATYLIREIPSPSDRSLSLWIVSEELFAPGKRYIFGAAGESRALASLFMLDSISALCGVAVHEVCHMLGLSHCSHPCSMRPARTPEEAESRPLSLCGLCRTALERTSPI